MVNMVNFSTSALVIITLFTCSLPFSVGFKAHICPVIARQPNLLTGTSKQISQQTARTSATLFGRSRTITNDNIFELYEDETGECDDMDSTFVLTTPGGKTKSASQNDNEWMFFDVAKINVKGGDGGDGCMAMQREFRIAFGGPAGGNGGDGGSIYLKCDKRLNTLGLLRRRVHHRGKGGTNGKGDSRHGVKAEDVYIPVPPGTIVRDADGVLAGELNQHGQTLLVARGGKGGRGNEHFKTARMNAPTFAEKGEPGAERWLQVELKLIADVGLVGVPNAGKSTLLAASSNAKPKIADYPFTTIVPNLGVCDLFDDYLQQQQKHQGQGQDGSSDSSGGALVIADIPGLLEGAHEGVGLGTSFLRHVQRCRVLVHVVNGDSEDPVGDFRAINQELELFNPALAQKTQVVVVNKVDIPAVRERLEELTEQLRWVAGHSRVMGVSAATGERVKELMRRVHRLVGASQVLTDGTLSDSVTPPLVTGASGTNTNTAVSATAGSSNRKIAASSVQELFTPEEERVSFEEDSGDNSFVVQTDARWPGQFRVVGRRIEKIVSMTNWEYYEAVRRFQRILEAQGISEALRRAGAQQGDLVMVGDWDFNYWEPRNRWIAELGLEDVNPRKRQQQQQSQSMSQLGTLGSGAAVGKQNRKQGARPK